MSHPDTTPNADGSVPIKLLHDRLLVHVDDADGDRRSSGGILIPATAAVGRRGSPRARGAQRGPGPPSDASQSLLVLGRLVGVL